MLRGIMPVSYTHLRAHETVLDLVCRLLLEKKNSNKSLGCQVHNTYEENNQWDVVTTLHACDYLMIATL